MPLWFTSIFGRLFIIVENRKGYWKIREFFLNRYATMCKNIFKVKKHCDCKMLLEILGTEWPLYGRKCPTHRVAVLLEHKTNLVVCGPLNDFLEDGGVYVGQGHNFFIVVLKLRQYYNVDHWIRGGGEVLTHLRKLGT